MHVHDLRVARAGHGSLHLHVRWEPAAALPAVIFSHGFSVDGTESHRMFLKMADQYNRRGIATVNFDYYGCGYSDGDFTDFTVSSAVSDLHRVLSWARAQPQIDASRIVIHGQSLGTAIAAIVGARLSQVRGYVLWNLSADLPRRYRQMLGEEVFVKGFTWLGDKGLMVRRSFMEDLQQYDVLGCFTAWSAPTLFLNSGSDTKGEPALSEKAHRMIGSLGTRVVIAGANHSFKCQPDLEDQAMSTTLSWVVKLLDRL